MIPAGETTHQVLLLCFTNHEHEVQKTRIHLYESETRP